MEKRQEAFSVPMGAMAKQQQKMVDLININRCSDKVLGETKFIENIQEA